MAYLYFFYLLNCKINFLVVIFEVNKDIVYNYNIMLQINFAYTCQRRKKRFVV